MNEQQLYLIQFTWKGEVTVYWPPNAYEFGRAVFHLHQSGCKDYQIGKTILSIMEDGSLRVEWKTIEQQGSYKKKELPCSNTLEA